MVASTKCFIGNPHKHNQQMKMGASTICLLDIPTNITNKWKWEPAQFVYWTSPQTLPTNENGSQHNLFTGHPHKHNQQMKMGVSTICFMGIATATQARRKRKPAQLASSGFPTKIRQMKIRAFLIGHPHKITNKWKCESASQLKVQRYAGIRYNQNVANDCWIICKKKPFPKTFNWTLSLIVDGLHL